MMRQQRFLLLVLGASLSATLACATVTSRLPLTLGATATPPARPTSVATERQLAVLGEIDTAVRERYIREDLDGLDWDAVLARYRARIEAGLTEAEFAAALDELAAEFPTGGAFYTSRTERLEQETTSASTYQGIGVFYAFRETPEPRVLVLSVIQGSPAEAAGLQPHDAIYAVDGEPVRADEATTIFQRIRGEAGSSVTLTVQTPGEPRRDITLNRASITSGDILRGGPLGETGAVYYRLPVFSNDNLAEALAQDFSTQPADTKGVILDLRTTRSLDIGPLLQLLTIFTTGELGTFYTRTESQPLTLEPVDVNGSQTVPLVVLIGRDTESQGEVLAAILQATGRAKLVGQPTPGTVELLEAIDLSDGSRFALATSSFRLPDGSDPGLTGVQPDLLVDGDWDTFSGPSTDPVLKAALEALGLTSP